MNQIEQKLDSAQRKFVPTFGEKSKQDAKVTEFQTLEISEGKGKTPSTSEIANRASISTRTPKNLKIGASAITR